MSKCIRHSDREAVYHFTGYCNRSLHTIEHYYCERCMKSIQEGVFHCSQCNREGKGVRNRQFTILTKTDLREKEESAEPVQESA
jgi:predicted amidophosphoribosyltransferase